MKKSKIYTRTGDAGETSLVSGTRIKKSDQRIDLYGELDELNARLGVVCSYLAGDISLKDTLEFLHSLQSAIFDLGSNLACEFQKRQEYKLPQIGAELVTRLEAEIDTLELELEPLKNFILPGGTLAASAVHLARTGARNVERKMISYHQKSGEELPLHALVFLNRLSDYLFVLARYVNKIQQGTERSWKPSK